MTLEELLVSGISEKLITLTISGPKNIKKMRFPQKIKVRPVQIKNEILFQAEEFVDTKVYHNNYSAEEMREKVTSWVEDYKQAQFLLTDANAQVLSAKDGHLTIKYKRNAQERAQKSLAHNRSKSYILKEGEPIGFLVDLGVMTPEGKIVRAKYDKYRQINRFLEFIEDILPQLDEHEEQTIIDFGCGKSYLTFALYYYLKVLKGYNIRIIGLDLKADVIAICNRLAAQYGFENLHFYVGDIASYKDVTHVDMVVTLHACDTATDYALAKAVEWGAKVILSVPCCQHEANAQIASEALAPILKYGILKERMSALITDAVRANLLESVGYQTQILEFIDMEHTPKNLLIRAIYTGTKNEAEKAAILEMESSMNLALKLNELLQ